MDSTTEHIAKADGNAGSSTRSPFLDACRCKPVEHTPIWIMRQAGRYLKEFKEIRKNNPDFINLCLNTDLGLS